MRAVTMMVTKTGHQGPLGHQGTQGTQGTQGPRYSRHFRFVRLLLPPSFSSPPRGFHTGYHHTNIDPAVTHRNSRTRIQIQPTCMIWFPTSPACLRSHAGPRYPLGAASTRPSMAGSALPFPGLRHATSIHLARSVPM